MKYPLLSPHKNAALAPKAAPPAPVKNVWYEAKVGYKAAALYKLLKVAVPTVEPKDPTKEPNTPALTAAPTPAKLLVVSSPYTFTPS